MNAHRSPPAARVIGQRLDIATRHTPDQIMDMLRGNVFEHLFVKELLVGVHARERARSTAVTSPTRETRQ